MGTECIQIPATHIPKIIERAVNGAPFCISGPRRSCMQCLQHKVETLDQEHLKMKLSSFRSQKNQSLKLVVYGESSSRGTAVSRSDSASHSAGNRHLAAAEMQRQRLKKLMEEMNEEGDGRSA